MTKIFNAIVDFFLSDLYLYICLGMILFGLALIGICKLIEYILERRSYDKFLLLMDKYGIPRDIVAPDYVVCHMAYLIFLCEKYNFDSLYEAQNKFDELFSSYWNYKKLPDKTVAALQSLNPGEREFVLRALRHGEAVERKNDIEVNNYPTKEILKIHQEKFAGRYFISEQRPSSSEDKP